MSTVYKDKGKKPEGGASDDSTLQVKPISIPDIGGFGLSEMQKNCLDEAKDELARLRKDFDTLRKDFFKSPSGSAEEVEQIKDLRELQKKIKELSNRMEQKMYAKRSPALICFCGSRTCTIGPFVRAR